MRHKMLKYIWPLPPSFFFFLGGGGGGDSQAHEIDRNWNEKFIGAQKAANMKRTI